MMQMYQDSKFCKHIHLDQLKKPIRNLKVNANQKDVHEYKASNNFPFLESHLKSQSLHFPHIKLCF